MHHNSATHRLRLLSIATTTLLALLSLGVPTIATIDAAQQDETEWILKYGPNTEMFDRDNIEIALQGWKWQLEFSSTQQELVAEMVAQIEQQLKTHEARIQQLQETLGEAGVPATIDNKTVAGIHQAIRVSRGELSGLEAKLVELEIKTKDKQTQLKTEFENTVREIELLGRRAVTIKKELDRVKKLKEKGFVPEESVDKVKMEMEEAEMVFSNAQEKASLLKAQMAGNKEAGLVVVLTQIRSVQEALKELNKQKEAIEKSNPLQKMEQLNREIGMSTQMLEMARMKQMELQLESTRIRALVLLTEKRLAALKPETKPETKD